MSTSFGGKGESHHAGRRVDSHWRQWLADPPQFAPSVDLNRAVVERHGFRGCGGPSKFWNYSLEFYTLMAGRAAVISRIPLFATRAAGRRQRPRGPQLRRARRDDGPRRGNRYNRSGEVGT